ncbi:MAG: Smr/MutS family protein [Marinilabiliaceae bacterium]|nr:Smr/MutS family protein [Marinilabiliaceae bacterium]
MLNVYKNIYPDSFETKLKFEKIREMIADNCLCNLGIENVEKMCFSDDFSEVHLLLKQTEELLRIETEGEDIPTSYFFDLRQGINKIAVEGLYLEEQELFDLRRSLGTIKDLLKFINSKEANEFPQLHNLAINVMVYPAVIERIDIILNKQGKIKDNASPELAGFRKEITQKQQSVSKRMQTILKQAKQIGLVETDVSVTIRDGRAVIPVLATNKRKFPGIVHDESATGRTSYIEPSEIVELNNQIRELIYAERRELIRILKEFSIFLRPYSADLLYAYDFLGIIDFIRAKARFALQIEAIVPQMENEPHFKWIEARHPLLYIQLKNQGKKIVPLNIETSPTERIIIISGPNAGGKSVCLQTVGIIQYMLQCGLPVPVKEGSQLGLFKKIFLDIGDEQSIENDLSTYSSHLLNMKTFVKQSDEHSLLLIDEFGTGTEPMLGGAIAESILQQLNKQGVYGVITTHYTNLKHFAAETSGIVNGAMLFDTHNICPLFSLKTGQPGSSFAFEIARKIGLPETILESAQEKLGEDRINFDKHLREIIRDKRYWEQKRNSVKEQERKLDILTNKYENELENLISDRKEILKKAREDAALIISGANREIEITIKQIRETEAEKEKTKSARQKLEEYKEKIFVENDDTFQLKYAKKISSLKNKKKKTEKVQQKLFDRIEKGDFVKLHGYSIPGEVLEIRENDALVAFGQLITNTKLILLEKISKNEFKRAHRQDSENTKILSEILRKKKLNFTPNIDIRGMRGDEALERVTIHIDEAIMCGVNELKILHGKGNGILRQLIRQQLATMPFVKHFADEQIQFGGSGITVVTIE